MFSVARLRDEGSMEELIEQYKDVILIAAGLVGIGWILTGSVGTIRQTVWEFLFSVMVS